MDDLSTLPEVHVDTHVPRVDAVLAAVPGSRTGGVSDGDTRNAETAERVRGWVPQL
ncbi:hypothetical protein [Haloechinothrix salitolerans]|uniref:Uncharacterized protein n=1 Tax=Haloechinothrix salitolerans TaxID=926830 RepID=A0ABW2C7T8_9PSEU